jgi:hypothetical protein
MFHGLQLHHEIVDIVYDNKPSYYIDNQVLCKSKLRVEADSPRLITEIFHLHLYHDTNTNVDRLICSKHCFVVTDPRPLYINADLPPYIPPEEESEYDSNDDDSDYSEGEYAQSPLASNTRK